MNEEEKHLTMAIDYMAMSAIWDPPTVAHPHQGNIVVFCHFKGSIMLGQVEKVFTHPNLNEVINQHTWGIENGIKRRITSGSTLKIFSDQKLHCQVMKHPLPKGIFREYAVKEIIDFNKHDPMFGNLYG